MPILGACAGADLFGLNKVGERALLIYAGDTSEVTVPETVARSAPFDVHIRTFGGGCVRETGRTHVVEHGNEVIILPYNQRSVGEGVCTADILYLTHNVRIVRENPGDVVLRIVGHRRDHSTNFEAVPAELTMLVRVH
jgi:hypothetical protein